MMPQTFRQLSQKFAAHFEDFLIVSISATSCFSVFGFGHQQLNGSTLAVSQVRKADPVPASSVKATQHSNNNSTPATSQVRKVDPVPASSWKGTHQQTKHSTIQLMFESFRSLEVELLISLLVTPKLEAGTGSTFLT